jgi:O-acetyl-ADP-ribose deacetylase (regulator of RNase III)
MVLLNVMGVEIRTGNLLEAATDALVNTVNTVGVMGKGIALQFKQAFPDNFKAYEAACRRGEVQTGRMFVHESRALTGPRFIVNFPTKRHWKGRSRIEDIEAGLEDLAATIHRHGIRSIAVPPLGCGLGGLSWDEVRPRILKALGGIEGVDVYLYAPGGAPDADRMPVGTSRPKMTPSVAALLTVFEHYQVPGYRLGRLEAQKLAYFLQAVGEPLHLSFRKDRYGPYAEKLNFVLQKLEGHMIRGYGDRSVQAAIRVLPQVNGEIQAALKGSPETSQRVDRVSKLVQGFETPYGMEILATVHWLVTQEGVDLRDDELIVRGVGDWNARKAAVFSRQHVLVAAGRLRDLDAALHSAG